MARAAGSLDRFEQRAEFDGFSQAGRVETLNHLAVLGNRGHADHGNVSKGWFT